MATAAMATPTRCRTCRPAQRPTSKRRTDRPGSSNFSKRSAVARSSVPADCGLGGKGFGVISTCDTVSLVKAVLARITRALGPHGRTPHWRVSQHRTATVNILIVEDDAPIAQALEAQLPLHGFTVHRAETLAAAMERAEERILPGHDPRPAPARRRRPAVAEGDAPAPPAAADDHHHGARCAQRAGAWPQRRRRRLPREAVRVRRVAQHACARCCVGRA